MKHNKINRNTMHNWELLESSKCYRLYVSGEWELTIIRIGLFGGAHIISKFDGRYGVEEAYDAWYDLIG